MTYLYYNKDNQEQYEKDQDMLIELIKESETEEEKEYFSRALITLRLFGSAFI